MRDAKHDFHRKYDHGLHRVYLILISAKEKKKAKALNCRSISGGGELPHTKGRLFHEPMLPMKKIRGEEKQLFVVLLSRLSKPSALFGQVQFTVRPGGYPPHIFLRLVTAKHEIHDLPSRNRSVRDSL